MKLFVLILGLVLRMLFAIAIIGVSYQRGKGKTIVELTKACLPDANTRSSVSQMMFWTVALFVYHLPTLICTMVVRILAPLVHKSESIIDGPKTRKGVSLEED